MSGLGCGCFSVRGLTGVFSRVFRLVPALSNAQQLVTQPRKAEIGG
jgi:hypothetical protein